MSTQKKPRLPVEGISEEAVAHYLQTHPEFFERHSRLLSQLHVPHHTGGSAVSLIERQVEILRERNRKLDRKLRELMEVARANEALAAKIHKLASNLIGLSERKQVFRVLESALREDFGADRAVMVLFREIGGNIASVQGPFVHVVKRDDPALKAFAGALRSGRARCGRMRSAQRTFLFGEDSELISSAALVPLGESSRLGMLAIGSRDAEHFHPSKSTDFLSRLGGLVSRAIER